MGMMEAEVRLPSTLLRPQFMLSTKASNELLISGLFKGKLFKRAGEILPTFIFPAPRSWLQDVVLQGRYSTTRPPSVTGPPAMEKQD